MEDGHLGYGLDVCLAVPPFHTIHHPPLGPAILKRACEARGLTVSVTYGMVTLAALAGLEPYESVCRAPKYAMVGERLFRPHAYQAETLAQLYEPDPLPANLQVIHDQVKDAVGPALDDFVAQVLALRPRILGISSSFEQNLASVALARRVKAAAPEICIVMGGANVAWPMASGLSEIFPWIDYFFSGESDVNFPQFCERLIRRGERPAERVIRSEPIRDLRTVFSPDFSDYFDTLRPLQTAGTLPAWLPRFLTMETSRGCWWGAKHHCTFCGLNGDGMDFREKPAETVITELAEISRWGVGHIWMTDNIMPLRYLTELLPVLAASERPIQMFYEVKANLTEEQVDVMARGGITNIQPGIESLSSNVLRLMRKGVSAHQNIALLRSCAGNGMWVVWNILYGFPGETAQDYEAQITLLPSISHLQPATGAYRIIIDRYSPYFREPEAMGIGPIKPTSGYFALYPTEARVEQIAYHFAGNYSTEMLDRPELIARLEAAIDQWQTEWSEEQRPVLQVFETKTSKLIFDTRRIARDRITPLSAAQFDALTYFQNPRARAGLDPALAVTADSLLERAFLIEHEGTLLSVVVRPRHDIAALVKRLGDIPPQGPSTFA